MIRFRLSWICCFTFACVGWLASLAGSAEPKVYTPPERPRVFPAQSDFTIPLGAAQLFLPYLETPSDLPLDDYRLVLDMPAALRFIAVDSIAGVAGKAVKETESDGRRVIEIAIDNPFGVGMELSICWRDASPATIAYVPALRAGGTCGWRKLSGTLRSPPQAVSCKPLLIKWQRRGLFGAAYFDDIVVREAGDEENLLDAGTFEEPYWSEHPNRHVVEAERDGQRTHAARISGTRENMERQDALWVGEGFPVKPNTDYVFEAWAKCEAVGSTTSRPRAALLLRLDDPEFSDGEIRFGFRAHGGDIVEATQTIQVRALPKPLGKRPRESSIVPCYYGDVAGPEASAAIAENIRISGITGLYGRAGNRVAEAVKRAGGKLIWSFPYNSWQISPAADWVESQPERLAINFRGQRDKGRVCPTYALERDSEFAPKLKAWVRQAVADAPYDDVDVDYEVPVVDPPNFCFCPRCLDAFRSWAKLSVDTPLSAETIVAEHREQWTVFRCRQNAELIGRLARWIRAAREKLHVSVYSGYQSLRTREHYGVDWSLLAPHINLGVAGYGGSREALSGTMAALGETPFMGGEMYYLSFNSAERGPLRREGWKMRLLRCYVNGGCNGVLIWWLPVIDGQGYFETSQAAAIIADFEDFFRRGQRADARVRFAEAWPSENYAAFARDKKLLLLLFNPKKEQRKAGQMSVEGWDSVRAQRYDDVRGRLGPIQQLPASITMPALESHVWLLSEGE